MKNTDISSIFYEMADILEMQGVEWKPRAYRQAARTIESWPENLSEVYERGGKKALDEIPGIGSGMSKKIEEYIKTGKIKEHEKLKREIPRHILTLMNLPGMGAKKIKKLNKALNISNARQLERAAREHKISKVPGFGEKSERDILESIAIAAKLKERIPLKEAQKVANKIINELKKLKEVKEISIGGSLRRKRQTVGDVDVLASSANPEKIIDEFTKLKGVQKVMAKGPSKAIIIFRSGIQSDLRVFKPDSWGAGLFYNTGNKNYNIEMRRLAIRKGCKLNEYGLFKGDKKIAGKTEKEICNALGTRYLKPEEREK